MYQSEKVSANQSETPTKLQSKQLEKHSQGKVLPDCKTRIKSPPPGRLLSP